MSSESCGDGVYKGQVSGSQDPPYEVFINTDQPRRSTCTCPLAAGRHVVCKHMVALYFFHFPSQADTVLVAWEEGERGREERYLAWETEDTLFREEKVKAIEAYVKMLSEEQVREQLMAAL